MSLFTSDLWERGDAEGDRRQQMVRVMQAALDAVDAARAVEASVRREGHLLTVGDETYDLTAYRNIHVVGAGKAGAPMAQALEAIVGERLTSGFVNVKYEHVAPTEIVRLTEAGHPLPDEAGVEGARRIAEVLRRAGQDDLILCVISGGGSSLLSLPAEDLSLEELQVLTELLLRAGATINELNTVRKHLEVLKGGGLVRLASPARVVALVLSDVVGNPLDVIASGPTVPDTTTYGDAWQVLERHDLLDRVPPRIRERLSQGRAGRLPDTPKPGDPMFARTQNVVVASNDIAAQAATREARALGFNALLLSTFVEGEAREVAKVFAALAREVRHSGHPVPAPACLVAGGETTVTVRGEGRGGRNQEMALMAAMCLEGLPDVAIACLATDGTDGPTDASGAIVDGETIGRGRALGLDPWEYLRNNDSYHYFAPLGDLLLTGPTNTNVNDLTLVFVW